MTPSAEGEEGRRNAVLLLSLALAAAFIAAAWSRLSSPFSTSEAGFVHAALRQAGQATSPDFRAPGNPAPAQVLATMQQLVGFHERSLRLTILILAIVGACLLAELVPRASFAAGLVPLLAFLANAAAGGGRLVVEQSLAYALAPVALVAAPIGRPTTNLRAVLGLAAAVGLGALSSEASIVAASVLAVVSLINGSVLDRLTGLATAAAAVASGWVVHGLPERRFNLLLSWGNGPSGRELLDLAPFLGCLTLVVLSLFVRDEFRRQRLALAAGCAAGVAVAFGWLGGLQFIIGGPEPDLTDLVLAVGSAAPAVLLLLAFAVASFPIFMRGALVVLLIAAIVVPLVKSPPAPETLPLTLLDQARAVAQPGSALAVEGDIRVGVAVYARLGRAPMMPILYVPEDASRETLAALCRSRGVRQLWLHSREEAVPPGFSAPASRPSGAPALVPLVVEGS